jgi:hypothetical protein
MVFIDADILAIEFGTGRMEFGGTSASVRYLCLCEVPLPL